MSSDARTSVPPPAEATVTSSRIWRVVNLDGRGSSRLRHLRRRVRSLCDASRATVIELRADGSLAVLHAGCETAAHAMGVGAHRGPHPWVIANDNALPDALHRAAVVALGQRLAARATTVLLGIDHELNVVPSGPVEALCVLRESPFAPSAAHDLNNCLTAVACAAGTLLDDPSLDRDHHDAARLILDALRRAESLTRQMLSRERATHAAPAHIDLGRELLSLTPLLRRALPVTVRFVAEIDPDMPSARLVAGHLQRIVMNLVTNAGHAVTEGGTITLSAWGESSPAAGGVIDRAMIEVRDDGCGMAPDVLARLFEPWFSTRAGARGHGLGMATVRALIVESGGTVTVESREALGTRVTVALPAYTPRISAAVEAPPLNERG
jgi:signal transduction histidine kinase